MSDLSYTEGNLPIKEETVTSDTKLSVKDYEIVLLEKDMMILKLQHEIALLKREQEIDEITLLRKDKEINDLRQDLLTFENRFGITSRMRGPFT